MTGLTRSWIDSANDPSNGFPLNNLPCGVFLATQAMPHCCTAIGNFLLDLHALEAEGVLDFEGRLQTGAWNAFMASGKPEWLRLRHQLTTLLGEDAPGRRSLEKHLHPLQEASLVMPFEVAEFTDFYAGRHHATNVGTMFRGPDNALPPNWLHMPIGYNGRASSVVVSGTPVRRPCGQLKSAKHDKPAFLPSRRFDFELEMGAVIGQASSGPIEVAQAFENIFGYVLLNDWSARDIQAWEYQPLGPFQSKATATTISPWIVMSAALEPFRVSGPKRDVELLDYLKEPSPMLYDLELEVGISPGEKSETQITRTNMRELYYSPAQMLTHHTTSGCPMRVGDLLGTGTISGAEKENRGSLLELSWGGKNPISVAGGMRAFLEDGDTLTLRGHAQGDGYRIGFGECAGSVLPALQPA